MSSESEAVGAAERGARNRALALRIRERRQRAFRAYLDLLDTADWMRREVRGQMEVLQLTVDGFRVLEMLHREGPTTTVAFCEQRRCSRQGMVRLIRPLQKRGWVQCSAVTLPPVELSESRRAKRLRGQPRRGRQVGQISLTPAGSKFMGMALPRHAKLVFALMRALDGREQESLSQTCRKLREGDPVKFVMEMRMVD